MVWRTSTCGKMKGKPPSDVELDLYDDCLTNETQDVIDELLMSEDEPEEDFEGF